MFLMAICLPMYFLTSCSNDDDDNNEKTEEVSKIIGSWKYTFSTGYQIYTFYENGTGKMYEYDFEDHSYTDYFEYTYKNNTLSISWEDEVFNTNITWIDDDTIKFYDIDKHLLTLKRQ